MLKNVKVSKYLWFYDFYSSFSLNFRFFPFFHFCAFFIVVSFSFNLKETFFLIPAIVFLQHKLVNTNYIERSERDLFVKFLKFRFTQNLVNILEDLWSVKVKVIGKGSALS